MLKKFIQLLIFVGLLTNFAFADDFDVNKFVDEYGKEVQSIIKSNLKYAGTEDAVSAVSYTINPDGSVTDIKVKQASGTNKRISTQSSKIPNCKNVNHACRTAWRS